MEEGPHNRKRWREVPFITTDQSQVQKLKGFGNEGKLLSKMTRRDENYFLIKKGKIIVVDHDINVLILKLPKLHFFVKTSIFTGVNF